MTSKEIHDIVVDIVEKLPLRYSGERWNSIEDCRDTVWIQADWWALAIIRDWLVQQISARGYAIRLDGHWVCIMNPDEVWFEKQGDQLVNLVAAYRYVVEKE